MARAHPLGNFTVNHFSRLEIGEQVRVRFVVDLAEIPTFQEKARIDADGDGVLGEAELAAYGTRELPVFADALRLEVDGARAPLQPVGVRVSQPPGSGGLATLRLECDLVAALPARSGPAHRLRYQDTLHADRIGWRELVVRPGEGRVVYDSSVFGSALTDELRDYPKDSIAAPLNERAGVLSFSSGAMPIGAVPLRSREDRAVGSSPDRLAGLITLKELTPLSVMAALLLALFLGAMHALSPGHGKTIVGAYLVGSRGTARHALFLGLTVTVTHTAGVFALGFITLFASRYILPEQLLPLLSMVSGLIVVVIGVGMVVRRLRGMAAGEGHSHPHGQGNSTASHGEGHTHGSGAGGHTHGEGHPHGHGTSMHSHGGVAHTHLPPGAEGEPVTWRSLLGLGISGGLVPCPSALVVMLSAISFNRVGFGLLLIVAFSLGLAGALTAVGLLFVHGARFLNRSERAGRLLKVLSVAGPMVITLAGLLICYQALLQGGWDLRAVLAGPATPAPAAAPAGPVVIASMLGLGLVFGFKHALEADHIAAVTTIVSERKSILSSSIVGGLWGIGHSISLLLAGVVVLLLRIQIGVRTAMSLEFCVALMLIVLGVNAIWKVRRGGPVHLHVHAHGGRQHVHPHQHGSSGEHDGVAPAAAGPGLRPVVVGMVHGLAGSSALMLVVLTTIPSPLIGFVYLVLFGVGSIGGMMMMSALVGLPMHLTAARFDRVNLALRALAGVASLGLGVFMVYQIGFVEGLLR